MNKIQYSVLYLINVIVQYINSICPDPTEKLTTGLFSKPEMRNFEKAEPDPVDETDTVKTFFF